MITIIKGANPQLRINLEDVKFEDLTFAQAANPDLFVLKDEEGNETFRVELIGEPTVSKYGIVIPYQPEAESISFVVPLDQVDERLQAFFALSVKENLEAIIKQVNDFIEKVEAAKGDVQYV